MSKHTVIVGNIGTVVGDGTYTEALAAFREYRRQSKSGHGRASGEAVTWMKDNEIYMEYVPKEVRKEYEN